MIIHWITSIIFELFQALFAQIIEAITTSDYLTLDGFAKEFPVIGEMYYILRAVGIGLVLGIACFRLMTFFFGRVQDQKETPVGILISTVVAIVLVFFGNYILELLVDVFMIPYNAMTGYAEQFRAWNNSITSSDGGFWASVGKNLANFASIILAPFKIFSGIDTGTPKLLVDVIVCCLVVYHSLKVALEVVERWMVVIVLFYTSPLAWSTAASEHTRPILKRWFNMFLSQCLLLMLSAWSLKILLDLTLNQGVGLMQYINGSDGSVADTIMRAMIFLAFAKVANDLDSHIQKLGLNAVTTGRGMLEDAIVGIKGLKFVTRNVPGLVRSAGNTIGNAGKLFNAFGGNPISPMGGGGTINPNTPQIGVAGQPRLSNKSEEKAPHADPKKNAFSQSPSSPVSRSEFAKKSRDAMGMSSTQPRNLAVNSAATQAGIGLHYDGKKKQQSFTGDKQALGAFFASPNNTAANGSLLGNNPATKAMVNTLADRPEIAPEIMQNMKPGESIDNNEMVSAMTRGFGGNANGAFEENPAEIMNGRLENVDGQAVGSYFIAEYDDTDGNQPCYTGNAQMCAFTFDDNGNIQREFGNVMEGAVTQDGALVLPDDTSSYQPAGYANLMQNTEAANAMQEQNAQTSTPAPMPDVAAPTPALTHSEEPIEPRNVAEPTASNIPNNTTFISSATNDSAPNFSASATIHDSVPSNPTVVSAPAAPASTPPSASPSANNAPAGGEPVGTTVVASFHAPDAKVEKMPDIMDKVSNAVPSKNGKPEDVPYNANERNKPESQERLENPVKKNKKGGNLPK